MAQKKYAGLEALGAFLEKLKTLFATKTEVSQKSQVQMITSEGSETLPTLKIHKLSQEEFDESVTNGTIDENTLYLTPDKEIDLSGYATKEEVNEKANANHIHDDRYYTETEIDAKLASKSDFTHNHDTTYDAKGSADEVLERAKSYTDSLEVEITKAVSNFYETKVDAEEKLAEAMAYTDELGVGFTQVLLGMWGDDYDEETATVPTVREVANDEVNAALDVAKSYTDTKTANLISNSDVDTKISIHDTSVSAHNDIRGLITELTTRLNALADSDDITLDQMSEIVEYIKSNKDLIDSITTSKVSVSDIVDNLTTNVTNKPLSAAQGVVLNSLIDSLQVVVDNKAPTEHTHAISDVINLQSSLDDKVSTTRTINGKALSGNIIISASDVGADISGSASSALSSAKTYTDNAVAQKSQVQFITWEADD